VFLDYNRMARDQTIASAYSVRARPAATVSAPVTWDEVPDAEVEDFDIWTMRDRFARLGDVHATIDDVAHGIEPLLELYERQGEGEAPFPPQFAKQEGEPLRSRPSVAGRPPPSARAGRAGSGRSPTPTATALRHVRARPGAAVRPPRPARPRPGPAAGAVTDPRSGRRRSAGTTAARVCIALYLLLPALLTLLPRRPSVGEDDFRRLVDGVVDRLTFGAVEVSIVEVEVLANVLLLVPLGLLLAFAAPRAPLSLLLAVAALLSLAIETVQYLLLPGRIASLVDVLANTGGAAIGLVVAADLRRALAAARRRRRRPTAGR
jgi:VanZ family protein